jgi:hypothetical protein
LTVTEILSVESTILSEGLSIYPNPSSEVINIISTNKNITDIYLADITGKLLFTVSNLDTERQTIDVSSLTQGIYFVSINGEVTKKIVKN